MIEKKGRGKAIANSRTADLSTLPLKGSEAREHLRVQGAALTHLWLPCGGPFAFCRSAAHRHWGKLAWLLAGGGGPPMVGGYEQRLLKETFW